MKCGGIGIAREPLTNLPCPQQQRQGSAKEGRALGRGVPTKTTRSVESTIVSISTHSAQIIQIALNEAL